MYRINRYVGIELEVEEMFYKRLPNGEVVCWETMPKKSQYWQKKCDGSVGGSYGHYGEGVEYVFSKPMRGREVVDAVSNICSYFHYLENLGALYSTAVNNGFHLHLDYRNKPTILGINLCETAHVLYREIVRTVAEWRTRVRYCVQYSTTPLDTYQYYKNTLYSEPPAYMRNLEERAKSRQVAIRFPKYMWISPMNLGCHDTVEIRLHHGTSDRDEILTWAEFWSEFANLSDSGKFTVDMAKKDGLAGLLRRMTISDKTRERFTQCV